MTRRIAVRLPDEIVEFLDAQVAKGAAKSRAELVRRALERERKQTIAALDAELLAGAGRDRDMDRVAEHVARLPIDLE